MMISLIFTHLAMGENEELNYWKNNINYESNSYSKNFEDWYYLPGYPNYAPSGIPDFDQRQDETWKNNFRWSFCGPAALADIFWWLDSKNSDPKGNIGDGIDNYSLVQNYNPPGSPEPGPFLDDHNYNNVNDIGTSWAEYSKNGELIERLASYVDIYWHKIPLFTVSGTDRFQLSLGAKKWIKDAGLENDYKVENIFRPSFSLIDERLRNNDGIILRLGYYLPSFPPFFPLIFLHYVAVAGINSNGYIAVSDPEWDIAVPSSDPFLHNNPSIVSHDIYQVDFSSPYPEISSWWIPSFERHRRVLVVAAIIISEVD
jgi:hypothetical protein